MRFLAVQVAMAMWAVAALAAPVAHYGGFTIDAHRLPGGEVPPLVLASLQKQIDLVNGLEISEAAKAVFRSQTIHLTEGLQSPGVVRNDGLFLEASVMDPDKPILLHEVLHEWMRAELPGGARNAKLQSFYHEALSSPAYPIGSYMEKNAQEYFAMTASAVLYGTTAREPFTRAQVKKIQPDYYAWLVERFGLTID